MTPAEAGGDVVGMYSWLLVCFSPCLSFHHDHDHQRHCH